MPTLEVNEFTSYDFTPEEYALAYGSYTEMQMRGLQTQLAKFAQQRINLSPDTFPSTEIYIRANEYNRGLMDSMKFLLELIRALKQEVADLAAEKAATQSME